MLSGRCATATVLTLLAVQAAFTYLYYYSRHSSPSALSSATAPERKSSTPVTAPERKSFGTTGARRFSLSWLTEGNSTFSNTVTTTRRRPYYDPSGPTWKEGSFCESYVEKTFVKPVGVCGSEILPEDSIKCRRSDHSNLMVYCVLESVLLSGPKSKLNVQLLTGAGRSCPSPSLSGVEKTTGKRDPTHTLLSQIITAKSLPPSACQHWINKTAFFYPGTQNVHIYFRMNGYFNLHKAIAMEGLAPGNFVVIRHSSGGNYTFPEWEKKLFPELIHIDELPNTTTCFRRIVLVPNAFSCILFRCKMEEEVLGPCFECKGRGLYGSSLYSFRDRVISSCGLHDEVNHTGNRITIVSRTPYKRWTNDDLKKFQRVLKNENELITALRMSFPRVNVTVAHMESLNICTQVHLSHDSDVLMGVHGAGLVHLWWLQEDALALELNPDFEIGNSSFKMLARLTGRRYRSVEATGSANLVTVNVNDVIRALSSGDQCFRCQGMGIILLVVSLLASHCHFFN